MLPDCSLRTVQIPQPDSVSIIPRSIEKPGARGARLPEPYGKVPFGTKPTVQSPVRGISALFLGGIKFLACSLCSLLFLHVLPHGHRAGDHGDDQESHGDRTAQENGPAAVAGLQRLTQVLFEHAADDEADDQRGARDLQDLEEQSQKTEEKIGKYDLNDFFLFYMMRYGFEPEKIIAFASIAFAEVKFETIREALISFYSRFFHQQFKRSCLPDGPKVGSVTLSPRGDWRMPSDASVALWLEKTKKAS